MQSRGGGYIRLEDMDGGGGGGGFVKKNFQSRVKFFLEKEF